MVLHAQGPLNFPHSEGETKSPHVFRPQLKLALRLLLEGFVGSEPVKIPLEAGAQGILLTLSGDRATRRSADGRCPVDNVTDYFDVAVHQVRASSAGSRSSSSQTGALARRVLEADELTVLTGWAQALAEAIAYAPECVDVLLANAEAGAPWRDTFQIAQPSAQLSQAFYCLGRAVRDASFSEGVPTLELLQNSSGEAQPEQHELEMLVFRVLQSMLEQLRTRQPTAVR